MQSNLIRKHFLEFFRSKAHTLVPSAPITVKNDPTLLFTNAGMNQFKDFFLGDKKSPWPRVADTQKCLRVSGKHNDLEEVGYDTYHHTMFEMLGNWSFGDYFKKEAIAWAWELLTEVYKIDKTRLYITIFEGDEQDGVPFDQEAFDLWNEWVPEEKILRFGKKDNFWEMGESGPCGPCSEIHIDLRLEEEMAGGPAGKDLVNKGTQDVIEIWNLVFIQYNRMADRSLKTLPDKHVDTGMGFERLSMVLQGKRSSYDTDVFQPIIQATATLCGFNYGSSEKTDIAFRVVADHLRAVAFTIADGQLPSNTGAGYVVRRILRRAVRYGYSFLGFDRPFLAELLPVLAAQMREVFPELDAQQDFLRGVIREEENAFLRTLGNGIRRINEVIEKLKEQQNQLLDGAIAFELYDTYGFPFDLTELIARENGIQIDKDRFDKELLAQKDRSRAAAVLEKDDWQIFDDQSEVRFEGYDVTETTTRVLKIRKVKEAKGKELTQVVLENTPFYPEGGGQIGDQGWLIPENGNPLAVLDTKKENDLIVHLLEQADGLGTGPVQARVDNARRKDTARNHSATHLLHAALREILGSHVEQKGSLVTPDYLRFDFAHYSKVTDEQLREIEGLVNQKIRENISRVEQRNVPVADAMQSGARALFGEKYGDYVRVITFDPGYSVELCGGIHVEATGEIGLLLITSESAVAAGVRRIEAVTGRGAELFLEEQRNQLETLRGLIKNPKDPIKGLEKLIEEKDALQNEVEALQNQITVQIKNSLKARIQPVNGVNFIIEKIEVPGSAAFKNLAFAIKNEVPNCFFAAGAVIDSKPQLTVILDETLVQSHGFHAGNLVREMAKNIRGGGGGQAFYATAGGSDQSGLEAALQVARELMQNHKKD